MLTALIYDHAARLCSFEIAAASPPVSRHPWRDRSIA